MAARKRHVAKQVPSSALCAASSARIQPCVLTVLFTQGAESWEGGDSCERELRSARCVRQALEATPPLGEAAKKGSRSG